MKAKKNNLAVIYARLSKDDGKDKVSNSINNQIEICKDYALIHGLLINKVYYDDGYSGTNFNRPSFNQMIQDIEKKKVSIIIVKDVSRLGRNFLQTSYYIEDYFTEKKIRFISVNDNYDSLNNDAEISLPFKNLINSLYAKECSKKQRQYRQKYASKKTFATEGVYGYIKKNGKLVVDTQVSETIKLIYQKYLEGFTPSQIAKQLTESKIVTPTYHKKYELNIKGNKYKNISKYEWKAFTIDQILRERQYTGTLMNNNKTTIIEDFHEAIIDKETFNKVQQIKKSKIKPKTTNDDIRLKHFFFDENGKTYCFYKTIRRGKERRLYKLRDSSKTLTADIVHQVVYDDALKVYNYLLANPEIIINNYLKHEKRNIKKINISELTKKQNQLTYKTKELLENLVNKKITEDKYLLQMDETNKKLTTINEQINNFIIQNDLINSKIENIKKFIEYLKTHPIKDNKLDFIRLLVKKVIVTTNEEKQKKFTIVYNFEV